MASETTFGHWKVVFSWGKGRKMTFSQNPLNSRFWASGFWMSILSSANFKKDPPWNIFSLSVHAPATSAFWLHSDYILASCWLHSGYIHATYWLHSDYILITFWLYSDYVLAPFWQHSSLMGNKSVTLFRHSGGNKNVLLFCRSRETKASHFF